MKKIILAAMTVMALAAPASATSDWDMFWGTFVPHALNPAENGWNDFWGSCQNPNKSAEDCVGTIAAGTGLWLVSGVVGAVVIVSTLAGITER